MTDLDALELELRKLPGVTFVAFQRRDDAVVVQLLAPGVVAPDELRAQASALARAYVDRPAVVELAGVQGRGRVRLLAVRSEGDDVEIHLAHGERRVVGRAESADPSEVARATVEALEELSGGLPFRFDAAATFEHHLGEGVMVVLGGLGNDEARYGVAAAESLEQATVRATLSALNRHLAGLVG